MPKYSVTTGSPTGLSGAHDMSGTAGQFGGLWVAVAVVPLASGITYPAFTRSMTYGPSGSPQPMISLGAIDCYENPANGWVELFYLLEPPAGDYTINFSVNTAVESIVMESISYTGVGQVTPGSFIANVFAGVSANAVVPSAPGKYVIGAFACSQAITGVTGGNERLLDNVGTSGNAQNLLLADSPGAASVNLIATCASSAYWGVVACGIDAVTTSIADHQTLTDSLHLGFTGQSVSGVSASQLSSAASIVQGISDATSAIASGAQAATTDFGQAVQGMLGNLVQGFGFGNPGNLSPPQGASTYSAADAAGAAQAVVSTTQQQGVSLSAIQARLPSFYGGGGAGGLSEAVSINGSLPSGFTALAAGATPATSAAVFDTPATTDSHTVSASWSVADGEAKYLFLRGNSTLSICVYAKIQSNDPVAGTANCELVAVVAGQSTVFTTFALPGSGAFIAAQPYSVAAVGDVFTVSGPGGLNEVYTDSAGVSQVGSGYRYGGFGTDGWVRQVDEYTTAGSVSYVPPSWATSTDIFDVVVVGAGGGGAGGAPFYTGGGGGAGGWASLGRTAFGSVTSGSAWTGTVGAGGGGAGPQSGNGAPGAASTLTIPGVSTLTGAGGAGGIYPGGTTGASPGNISCDNALYAGGVAQGPNGGGNAPGGGGGGGWGVGAGANNDYPGGTGAPGAVWIAAIDTSVPGSIGGFSFFDNAPAGPQTASVATSQSTSSTTYTDLTTVGPEVTVTVGSSGTVILFLYAQATFIAGTDPYAHISYEMSGANTQAASDTNSVFCGFYGTTEFSPTGTLLLTGLSPGATTFKMQYRISTGECSFANRRISVIPL